MECLLRWIAAAAVVGMIWLAGLDRPVGALIALCVFAGAALAYLQLPERRV